MSEGTRFPLQPEFGGGRWLLAGAAGLILVFLVAAVLYGIHEHDTLLDLAADELTTVSRLTGDQLAAWHEDELHDIRMLASSETVDALLTRWRRSGAEEDRTAFTRFLSALRMEHGYEDLFICNRDGLRSHADSSILTPCNPVLHAVAIEALGTDAALTTDLYFCPNHGEIHIDFTAALGSGDDVALVGRFNASPTVFDRIRRWPIATGTAELFLLRTEGDSSRVLSPLRSDAGAVLRRTVPVSDTTALETRALRSPGSVIQTTDYRGEDVLAFARRLPGSAWVLVAKVDRNEVLGEFYGEMVLIGALVLATLIAAVSAISFWFSRRQSAMYRSMFEDHASVKLLINPETGAIVDANHAAVAFYGWSRDELRRMHIQDINILPEERVRAAISDTMRGGRQHHEFHHRLADGSLRAVEVFAGALRIGGVDLLYSIIHDVTGKKEAEHSIRLLGRSVEQSPVTIVITDPNGIVQYVNPEFTRVTGYTADEVMGRKTSILRSGTHSSAFYAGLWSTILSGKEWIGEFHNRRKNGELFWESAVISPVLSDEGSITHFIGIKTDVTAQKRLVSELVVAKEKAEESDRLKSAFLANMSHEIRTPINAVVGFADLLADPDISESDRKEFADVVRQRSYDLLNIINDILDISRIEAGVVKIVEEECSVREILEDLRLTFSRAERHRNVAVGLRNEIPAERDRVVTDAARVRQVLSNLLSNAVKFTHEGSVVFGCREERENELLFFVEDTGIGISADMQAIIFDRFRQADESSSRRYGGTGLGLAICHGIVTLLGGTIRVASKPGLGSRFTFTIPRNITA